MNVDIILPMYNPNQWVLDAVHSIENQIYRKWHLYIVDDNSELPNKYIDKIIELTNNNPKISYIRNHTNIKAASSRNIGVALGKGEAIAFIDQDDLWYNNKLSEVSHYFKLNKYISLVHSNITGIDRNGSELYHIFENENNIRNSINYSSMNPQQLSVELFRSYSVRLGTIVVLRDAFENAGGFDGDLFGGEDEEFVVRFASKYGVGHIKKPLIYRRMHSDNVSKIYHNDRLIGRYNSILKMINTYDYLRPYANEQKGKILSSLIKCDIVNYNKRDAIFRTISLIRLRPFHYRTYFLLICSIIGRIPNIKNAS